MIITIKQSTRETGDYGDYLKVIGVDGQGKEVSKNVSQKFEGLWGKLNAKTTWDFKHIQKNNKWQLDTIVPIGDELPPSTEVSVSPEHTPPPPTPPHQYAPQELGMWWKELGNRIGDGSLERDYPKAHVRVKGQYYKRMSEVTGVNFKNKE